MSPFGKGVIPPITPYSNDNSLVYTGQGFMTLSVPAGESLTFESDAVSIDRWICTSFCLVGHGVRRRGDDGGALIITFLTMIDLLIFLPICSEIHTHYTICY